MSAGNPMLVSHPRRSPAAPAFRLGHLAPAVPPLRVQRRRHPQRGRRMPGQADPDRPSNATTEAARVPQLAFSAHEDHCSNRCQIHNIRSGKHALIHNTGTHNPVVAAKHRPATPPMHRAVFGHTPRSGLERPESGIGGVQFRRSQQAVVNTRFTGLDFTAAVQRNDRQGKELVRSKRRCNLWRLFSERPDQGG